MSPAIGAGDEGAIALFDPTATILANRRLLSTFALVGIVLGALFSLLRGATYTSTASLLPQARRSPTNLPAVAVQLGLTMGNADANQSPQFYVDLLKSREILRPVVSSEYEYRQNGKQLRGTLVQLYGIDQPQSEAAIREAVDTLARNVSAIASAKTGVVSVSARTRSPFLASLVLRRMLDQLNTFNLESRQSQASAERRFTEDRRAQAQSELRAAEERLQYFLQENREWRSSPKLALEQDRLQRDIATKQQIYTTLAQAYEQARIDEVRNTPLITIVEKPDIPIKADSRHFFRNALFGAFALTFLGTLGVFARARFGRVRPYPRTAA
jgi:uncharacterized protein involved in exopolysaccharide biosynthesis